MKNQLAQVNAARGRPARPAPVITQHEESGITPNVFKLSATTRVLDYKVADLTQPFDFFQAFRPARLLEERAQVGAD